MSLWKRLKRLFTAQANATLDRMEDPERELELLAVELRGQRQECRQRLVDALAELKKLEADEASLQESIATWEQRAIKAVGWGDDALAKEALLEKSRLEHSWSSHLNDLKAHRDEVERMKDVEVELDRRIDLALRRQDALAGRLHKAQAMSTMGEAFTGVAQDSPMATFGQIDRDIDALEENVVLQQSMHSGVADIAVEQKLLEAKRFRETERAWQRDLAELKKRMAEKKDNKD